MEQKPENKALAHAPGITPDDVRHSREEADAAFNDEKEHLPIFHWEDYTIPDAPFPLPVRIYRPSPDQQLPILLYFHGGGFVLHNIASHDSLCRKLAVCFHCVVISVGYRLAPEFPYPAAIEDGYAALQWAAQQAAFLGGDPAQIMVGGDSAGANLSAALCILARDRKGPHIAAQLLFYGNFGCLSPDASPSMQAFGNGDYILTRDACAWFEAQYTRGCPPTVKAEATFSPGIAADLTNLPKALVITAQYDPLRDDGEAFAHRLEATGNRVLLHRIENMLHGFLLCWEQYESVEHTITQIGKWIKEL